MERISADRPGMGTGTDVLPQGCFQWETGTAYEYAHEKRSTEHFWNWNNSLFRYGATSTAELRLELNGAYKHVDGNGKWGMPPIIAGTKVRVLEGEHALPDISLLANFSIPTSYKDFGANRIAPSFHLLFSHTLNPHFDLNYEAGLEWDGTTSDPAIFTVVGTNYNLSDQWSIFVENYNIFSNHDRAQWNMDFGCSWTVTRRMQLDLAGAFSLRQPLNHYIISLGLAWWIH
ncbi:MAG: transporter [Bacteroidaceae bacterium]|nr:transporter [Bacteroidaceae bacterium]